MYVVWVYNPETGSFVPAREPSGKTVSREHWADAAKVAEDMAREGQQVKVQYAAPRRGRRR